MFPPTYFNNSADLSRGIKKIIITADRPDAGGVIVLLSYGYTPPFFFFDFFLFFYTKRAIDDDMSWQTGDRDGPRCKALLDRRWCCKFKVAVANISSEKIARCSDNGPPAYSQGDERIVRRANKTVDSLGWCRGRIRSFFVWVFVYFSQSLICFSEHFFDPLSCLPPHFSSGHGLDSSSNIDFTKLCATRVY